MHSDRRFLLESLHIDHYVALLRASHSGFRALLLEADNEILINTGADVESLFEQTISATILQQPEQALNNGLQLTLDNETLAYLNQLKTPVEETIGTLVLLFDAGSQLDLDFIEHLCGLLINEYQLNNELETATIELSDRYEELNLVFGSDDGAEQDEHAVLSHLVQQCTERLNASAAVLYLPEQNIYYVDQDEAANGNSIDNLDELAEEVLMPWVCAQGSPIVVNDEHNPQLLLHCPTLNHKLLMSPIHAFDGMVCGYIAAFGSFQRSDFSNSDKNLLQVLSRKATRFVQRYYDPLTGLSNALSFQKHVQTVLDTAAEQPKGSLLLLDVRGLHVINNSSGMKAGDALLCFVAELLHKELSRMAVLQRHSLLARIDSDVFGVVVNNSSLEFSMEIAQYLLNALGSVSFAWEEEHFQINACIGIVPIDFEQDAEFSIANAKIALELACERGNNIIEVQDSENSGISERKERIRVLSVVQRALERNQFELFAQGIFAIQQPNPVHHYEILLRIRDDQGNIVSPGKFIPAAEYYKVMPDIDRWVIHQTLQQLSAYPKFLEQSGLSWAINLSGQTFSQEDLYDFIRSELHNSAVPAECLAFEVTETVGLEDLSQANEVIKSIKALGCEFYLDDFGTGLSSFTYLQQLAFNHVKVDGSFVKRVRDDSVARAMVRSIADISKELGMRTVAEFVEDRETIDVLAELGVDLLQGYVLHKPEPLAELLRVQQLSSKKTA